MQHPPPVLIVYKTLYGIVVQVGDVKVTAPTLKAALAVFNLQITDTDDSARPPHRE